MNNFECKGTKKFLVSGFKFQVFSCDKRLAVIFYIFFSIRDGILLTRHSNFLDAFLEVVAIGDGSVLHAGTVVVDGVHRVVQELGNLR